MVRIHVRFAEGWKKTKTVNRDLIAKLYRFSTTLKNRSLKTLLHLKDIMSLHIYMIGRTAMHVLSSAGKYACDLKNALKRWLTRRDVSRHHVHSWSEIKFSCTYSCNIVKLDLYLKPSTTICVLKLTVTSLQKYQKLHLFVRIQVTFWKKLHNKKWRDKVSGPEIGDMLLNVLKKAKVFSD